MATLSDSLQELLERIKLQTDELNTREELIKSREDDYQRYLTQLEKLKKKSEEQKIRFNVSGKIFTFTIDQLTYYPDSFFARLVAWKQKSIGDEIYIDRDPKLFTYIAKTLYNPDIIYTDVYYEQEHKYYGLKRECEYFGVPFNLRHQFEDIICGKLNESNDNFIVDIELEQGCLVVVKNKVYWLPISDNIAKILKKVYGERRNVENIIPIDKKLNIVGKLYTYDYNYLETLNVIHRQISYSDDDKEKTLLFVQRLKKKNYH